MESNFSPPLAPWQSAIRGQAAPSAPGHGRYCAPAGRRLKMASQRTRQDAGTWLAFRLPPGWRRCRSAGPNWFCGRICPRGRVRRRRSNTRHLWPRSRAFATNFTRRRWAQESRYRPGRGRVKSSKFRQETGVIRSRVKPRPAANDPKTRVGRHLAPGRSILVPREVATWSRDRGAVSSVMD